MIPDELFESLCSPGQDVCPLRPAPARSGAGSGLHPVCRTVPGLRSFEASFNGFGIYPFQFF